MTVPMPDAVSLAVVYPDLLGTYGDGGNATILAQRLRWRGIPAEVVEVKAGETVPATCDAYVLGGGEDAPQTLAADQLIADGVLAAAVDRGATVLAICAGLQVVGRSFLAPDGRSRPGVGLLDCTTGRTAVKRAVGELVVEPGPDLNLPVLSGYENHAGITTLGPTARPLGRVITGIGNGNGDGTEGVVCGKVLGTYLHGPALARNPALADLVLGWIVGPLEPLDDSEAEGLREERLRAVRAASHDGVGRKWWRLGR
jgi:CobQ-like glutamine amidotransferase family enzyme